MKQVDTCPSWVEKKICFVQHYAAQLTCWRNGITDICQKYYLYNLNWVPLSIVWKETCVCNTNGLMNVIHLS